jgi:hypothetical protein
MLPDPSRFVPKVHPASRAAEPEDPLALHAIALEGDPELMLECLVQEYAGMGWDAEQILHLFRDPSYPALNELRLARGEARLRERVHALVRQAGGFYYRVTVREGPEESVPELLPLGIPAQWRPARPEGGDHA